MRQFLTLKEREKILIDTWLRANKERKLDELFARRSKEASK